MEPTFDVKFAELSAKVQGVLTMLIAEYPEAAIRAREIIETAVDTAAVQAEFQNDEARSNVISALISGAGQMLATVQLSETPEAPPEEAP